MSLYLLYGIMACVHMRLCVCVCVRVHVLVHVRVHVHVRMRLRARAHVRVKCVDFGPIFVAYLQHICKYATHDMDLDMFLYKKPTRSLYT